MTDSTALPPVQPAASPAPSIPSFFAIIREALRLYRRRFWAYFCVTGIVQATIVFLLLVIEASARPSGPVPAWLSSLCRFLVQDIRSAPGMIAAAFCLEGLAAPTLVALALADARGVSASAPEAFIRTLPRLHSFIIAWLPASLLIGVPMLAILVGLIRHAPRVAVVVVPGALLYVGVSLMEPAFVAEWRGPLGALWRSLRLSWRRGVWPRLVALMLLPCVVWPAVVFGAGLLVGPYWSPLLLALRRLGIETRPPEFTQSMLWFVSLALSTALLLPLFMLFKVVLYRHAVLLYPPLQSTGEAPHAGWDGESRRSLRER